MTDACWLCGTMDYKSNRAIRLTVKRTDGSDIMLCMPCHDKHQKAAEVPQ